MIVFERSSSKVIIIRELECGVNLINNLCEFIFCKKESQTLRYKVRDA